MLREFRVDNFKSLINIVFQPQEINLLLGRNNSGKTNLCQALQFVGVSSLFPLNVCAERVAGGLFGMTNFAFDKSTIDFYVQAQVPCERENLVFEYELTILPPQNPVGEALVRVEVERLTVTGGKFDKTILLENISGRSRILDEKKFMAGTESYFETTVPRETTLVQRLYDFENHARAHCFKRYLNNWIYYDLSPTAMRGADFKPNEFFLNRDGSNLASVLYRLKTSDERNYRKLLKVVREIEPKLDLINFHVVSESGVFMFFEDSDGHSLNVGNASSGTLRFLALAYIFLIQPTPDSRPLLMIEEPENGIYVDVLKTLLEMSSQSPGRPQLVFTSHAPYFIDLFDEYLDGIFVLHRGEQHTSITQPNVDDVKARLEHFPLGDQHFRELLI